MEVYIVYITMEKADEEGTHECQTGRLSTSIKEVDDDQ
ncbi:unnamed protein product [Ectocarpus sp. CCAP 1310/34]|nr:unnamed protein product [Ectocarpus sp. CCAP 1310/34]